MFKIKCLAFVLFCCFIVACKTADIPVQYQFKPGEVERNPYGSWVKIQFTSLNFASGELLALEEDSLYLLIADGTVFTAATSSVSTAQLYTHKNQAGTYVLLSLLFSAPAIVGALVHTEYAGGFLSMGAMPFIPGFVVGAIEAGRRESNILVYPQKQQLIQLKPYARFPAGLPVKVDYKELMLKEVLEEG
jgi:hypothetical protein